MWQHCRQKVDSSVTADGLYSRAMVGLWPHRAFTFRLVVALPLEQHSPRFASVIDPLGIARLSSAGRINQFAPSQAKTGHQSEHPLLEIAVLFQNPPKHRADQPA